MKQKKKNGFFTFILSFIPGAAEMYMGFMKMGFSMMCIFALCVILPVTLESNDIAMIITFVVWAVGFFHARNIASMKDDEFYSFEDHYIWDEFVEEKDNYWNQKKRKKWLAIVLIIVGASSVWSGVSKVCYQLIPDAMWQTIYPIVASIPSIAIAILIIVVGVKLIQGKKEEMSE